jgi:hypothetical protein
MLDNKSAKAPSAKPRNEPVDNDPEPKEKSESEADAEFSEEELIQRINQKGLVVPMGKRSKPEK